MKVYYCHFREIVPQEHTNLCFCKVIIYTTSRNVLNSVFSLVQIYPNTLQFRCPSCHQICSKIIHCCHQVDTKTVFDRHIRYQQNNFLSITRRGTEQTHYDYVMRKTVRTVTQNATPTPHSFFIMCSFFCFLCFSYLFHTMDRQDKSEIFY